MKQILNLTNHRATAEQQALGVVDPAGLQERISQLLTFDCLPPQQEIRQRCRQLLELVQTNDFKAAHIGGAPFLTVLLHEMLLDNDIDVYYSYSKRISCEKVNEFGQVEKKSIFQFEDFVIFKSTNN